MSILPLFLFSRMQPPGRCTLITGASSDQGIALTQFCLERGDRVVAASRNPAISEHLTHMRSRYQGMDLVAMNPWDASSVASAIPVLEQVMPSIDMVIIGPVEEAGTVAGQGGDGTELNSLSATGMLEYHRRHAVAPLLLVRTLLPLICRSALSRVVLIAHPSVSSFSYMTEAANASLRTFVRSLSKDLRSTGIRCMLAAMDPERESGEEEYSLFDDTLMLSAAGVLSVADRLSDSGSGSFYDYTGTELR